MYFLLLPLLPPRGETPVFSLARLRGKAGAESLSGSAGSQALGVRRCSVKGLHLGREWRRRGTRGTTCEGAETNFKIKMKETYYPDYS